MPKLDKIIDSIGVLKEYIDNIENNDLIDKLLLKAQLNNPWFSVSNSRYQLASVANEYLDTTKLIEFLGKYKYSENAQVVGIIAAGNLPLVCLHDVLCVLLSGHQPMVKLSSQDMVLTSFFIDFINNELGENWILKADRLRSDIAVIATGSNASMSIFKKYFNKMPALIRGSRTSLAVMTGYETESELALLCDDMFIHFGLGCRNITYLIVPNNYDFLALLQSAESKYSAMFQHTKYMNNYDYRKTIMLLNSEQHYCTDFVLLQQSEQLFSPISCLHYQMGNSDDAVKKFIYSHQHELQCVVGLNTSLMLEEYKIEFNEISFVAFGSTQRPSIGDFADGVNTMQFLDLIK